ncbi:MAG: tRNA preQ1(34) S-adenosylmethionine ribosyltransferase-isomerase QueA [Microcystaceae cyanobacterium]
MSNNLLSDYNYCLPTQLIAQTPVIPRDQSRLLVVESPSQHHHQYFYQLPQWLQEGDLLVLNNTKVIPARLYGQKTTGAPVEILLLEQLGHNRWLTLVKPGKKFKIGSKIYFSPELEATVIDRDEETGGRILGFHWSSEANFWDILEKVGQIPFPPYVKDSQAQPDQYQTIYAQIPGAVAAPTAGLHFTDRVFQGLTEKGINTAEITLHVGVGTFRPVEVDNIKDHQMHAEWLEIPPLTVEKIKQTKAQERRVFAVGTTVVRALEGATQGQTLSPFRGKTDIFIHPGYQWRIIDGLITNFHLPKSSLLMLVSALIGRERLLSLYEEAINKQYRFYSFGDAMLILPDAKLTTMLSNQ